jgi:hypothetical protein
MSNYPGLFRWQPADGIDQPGAGHSLPQLEFQDRLVRVLTFCIDPDPESLKTRNSRVGVSTPATGTPAI